MKRAEIKITGQVQGVFFRQSTKEKADELNIVGWVRNEPDESVLIAAEGEEENLQKLIEWTRVGTKFAKVERVEVEWGGATNEFYTFEMK